MKRLNFAATYLRILFLALILIVNVLGFHYYFKPAPVQNYSHLPANVKFLVSFNLKSISGKLFHLFLFSPEDFEKDIISGDEKNLVYENSQSGINPFGWISVFSFPYNEKMIGGLSINLDNNDLFIEFASGNSKKISNADDVTIIFKKDWTIFVYSDCAVILWETFNEESADELALKILQNESENPLENRHSDFYAEVHKDLLVYSSLKNYFNLIPDFAHKMVLDGNFENGAIQIQSSVFCKSETNWPKHISFSDSELSNTDHLPFVISLEGKDLIKPLTNYIQSVFQDLNDSATVKEKILSGYYHSIGYSVKNFNLETDLIRSKTFIPAYKTFISLNFEDIKGPRRTNYHFSRDLKRYSDSIPLDLNLELAPAEMKSKNAAYIYINPSEFINQSDLSFIFKSVIDPFIVFDAILLKAFSYEKEELKLKGGISFKDKKTHSLIQLRLLFKNISSFI